MEQPPLPPWILDKQRQSAAQREKLEQWLQRIPVGRALLRGGSKCHREFRDAVAVAEIIHHFRPRWVELHNYVQTLNSQQRVCNWEVLQRRVSGWRTSSALPQVLGPRLAIKLTPPDVERLAAGDPEAIETLLFTLWARLAALQSRKVFRDSLLLLADVPAVTASSERLTTSSERFNASSEQAKASTSGSAGRKSAPWRRVGGA